MFVLNGFDKKTLSQLYKEHRFAITTTNVYYHNIRALKTRNMKFINKETYDEYYRGFLSDIDLESQPIETIIPNDKEDFEGLSDEEKAQASIFAINTEIPEYQRVSKRITLEDLLKTIPETNNTHVKMVEHPENLPLLVEEIFIFFTMDKYMEFIDKLHLATITNMHELIEYAVKNIDEKKLKAFIHTTKINHEKADKLIRDIVFIPEYKRTVEFYTEEHGDVPVIDVEKLISLLLTNTDTQDDVTFVAAIYFALSFAMVDICNDKVPNDEFPHVVYIRDVLSKIK